MSGPDLHVFTLKLLSLKKSYEKGIMQLVSAEAIVFSTPIISQPSPAQPKPQPTAQY